MNPRDDYGDKIPTRDVADEWDMTDSDRRSNRAARNTAPKTAGGAPPKWADDPWGDR